MSGPRVRFWGTRGSIPSPGARTLRYGGNTSCVEIRLGSQILICDSGTGIRDLGLSLVKEFAGRPISADLFITHTHWDHIQGFPFFVPAYQPQNRFRVYSAPGLGTSFEHIFRGQMAQNYFPVEIADMASQIDFAHVNGFFEAGAARVRTTFTNHPGIDVAYRFELGGRTVTYLTDHESHQALGGAKEFTAGQDAVIVDFCRDSDLLICDSQYTDQDYALKRGWGHSRYKDSLALALAAGAKRLALFHHDPVRDDSELDAIVKECADLIQKAGSPLECFAAREGQEVAL